MIDGILYPLTIAAALGCGLMAGLYLTFSIAVMPALDRLGGSQAVAAMQAMNSAILNPVFGLVFGGTALATAVLAVVSALQLDEPDAPYVLAGSLVYLAGSLVMTMAYHVPRNEALDQLDAAGPEATARWAEYHGSWTPWNHLRAVASLAAAALLVVALVD